jgi:hypothetical protein
LANSHSIHAVCRCTALVLMLMLMHDGATPALKSGTGY